MTLEQIKKLIRQHQRKHEFAAAEALHNGNGPATEAYFERGIALHDLMTDIENLEKQECKTPTQSP